MSQLDALKTEAKTMSRWQQNRFLIFVFGSILIALFLVFIAMRMYISSGASQLDLSLPAYAEVRDQLDVKEETRTFSSTGTIDDEVMDDFLRLFDEQAKNVVGVDGFSDSALSDRSLELPEITRPE